MAESAWVGRPVIGWRFRFTDPPDLGTVMSVEPCGCLRRSPEPCYVVGIVWPGTPKLPNSWHCSLSLQDCGTHLLLPNWHYYLERSNRDH